MHHFVHLKTFTVELNLCLKKPLLLLIGWTQEDSYKYMTTCIKSPECGVGMRLYWRGGGGGRGGGTESYMSGRNTVL